MDRLHARPAIWSASLLVMFLLSLAGSATPATIGPDTYGYYAKDHTYSWVDATDGTKVLGGEDDQYATMNIGFTFQFYGTNYTQVRVDTNGWIAFGDPLYSEPFNESLTTQANVPTWEVDLPTIAVYWDDVACGDGQTGNPDAVYYKTQGSAGSREFIVQWNDVQNIGGGTGFGTFEAILYEGTRDIVLQYRDLDFGHASYDDGASATIGIRDTGGHNVASGGNGENLQWSYNSTGNVTDGDAIRYMVPEPGVLSLFALGALGLLIARRRKSTI